MDLQAQRLANGELARKDCYTKQQMREHFMSGGKFHALDATIPIEAQAAKLERLIQEGIITKSPEPAMVVKQLRDGMRIIPWSTDHVHLSEASSVMCFDALLQAMSGLSMEARRYTRTHHHLGP